MISSFALKLWQTHVQEKNFYAPQILINYTHSHIFIQTDSHVPPTHVYLHSYTHTHTYTPKTTDSLMASIHEPRHRHWYTPTWLAWLLSTSGPLVTHIHPRLSLSPWQQILTTITTPPSMAGLQDQWISQLVILNIPQTDFYFAWDWILQQNSTSHWI